MRRAVVALLLLTAALPPCALAAKPEGPVDAIAMIDYKRGRHFKVGDWVRYRTKGESAQGYKTDYTVTLLIGGEELWWGEECFWVETQTAYSGQAPEVTASLLSYAVFQDSFPALRFRRYIRKYTEGIDADGEPIQQLFVRSPNEIRTRGFAEYEPVRKVDTLGVEKVQVPKGEFDALRVNQLFREYTTKQDGDSTVYFELTEDHGYWWSNQVPLTSLVRQQQENTQRRRVWMWGRPEDAPLRIVEHTLGSTELLDFGSGLKALRVPERLQRPLSEQRPARPTPAPSRKPPAGRG